MLFLLVKTTNSEDLSGEGLDGGEVHGEGFLLHLMWPGQLLFQEGSLLEVEQIEVLGRWFEVVDGILVLDLEITDHFWSVTCPSRIVMHGGGFDFFGHVHQGHCDRISVRLCLRFGLL